MKKITMLVLLALLGLLAPAWAQAPNLMNYQGVLKDNLGNPLTGSHSITFRLYDVATGGTALWTETQATVSVANGLFSVLLGSVTALAPANFSAPDRWLGVQVGSDAEMTPRQRIASVAYALKSHDSPNFGYVTSFIDWRNNATCCPTAATWYDIPGRTIAYTKQRATSLLRATYQDTLGTSGTTFNQCQWRILVDSTQIGFFSDADMTAAANWRMSNAAHQAIGSGFAAGSHTIKVQSLRNGATECLQGWNTVGSFLSVEEIGP